MLLFAVFFDCWLEQYEIAEGVEQHEDVVAVCKHGVVDNVNAVRLEWALSAPRANAEATLCVGSHIYFVDVFDDALVREQLIDGFDLLSAIDNHWYIMGKYKCSA